MLTKIIYIILLLLILMLVDNIKEKFTNSNNKINKLKYKIYWINMSKSISRRIWMENQFKKFNVLYNERIKAIDGRKMNTDNLIIDDIDKYKKNEIACTLSHLEAIKKAYDNDDEICYVMEDDISLDLVNDWNITIAEILKKVPEDWEIINLSLSNPNVLENSLVNSNLIVKWNKDHTSTLCYIINRKGIKKIYDIFNLNENNINFTKIMNDYDLDSLVADLILYKPLISYSLSVPLFTFEYFGSTIHENQEDFQNKGRQLILERYNRSFLNKVSIDPLPFKIYWINLKKSKDRNENMINQFNIYNIENHVRINAIDGNKLKKNDNLYYQGNRYKKFNINKKIKKRHSKFEIACTLSHLKCVFEAYKNNDELCIIMEDDISFECMEKWKYTLIKLIDLFPKNWEVINLCSTNPIALMKNLYNKKLKDKIFLNWKPYHYGAVCYIIKRKGIKKLVEKFSLDKKTINLKIQNKNSNIVADEIIYRYLKSYSLRVPLFVTNKVKSSTIHNNHLNNHNKGRELVLEYYNKLD